MLENRKIILYSVTGGVLIWLIDAVVDFLFFSDVSFLDSLIGRISVHEIYFRMLFLLGFTIFGFVIAGFVKKRRLGQEELKKAIRKVEEEKARSEAIVSAIGDGISIQDVNLKVLYQNVVQRNLVGGDKAGEYCYRVYADSDSICPGCPVILCLNDGGIHILEKTFRKDSQVRHIEIKASPLRDATGKIIAGIEAVRDITERKNLMERLKLFSEAIEEAMDGVQIVDLNGYVLYSNKAVQEIYGYCPQELAGRHVNEMNADREFASRVIIPRIKEAGRWSGEIIVMHKSGTPFPVWLSTSLVNDHSGNPIAMIGIIRDITERKRAEEVTNRHRQHLVKLVEERTGELSKANEHLRKEIADREKMEEEILKAQKLESLSILAGGIAHDFNNLLASILSNVSLAKFDLDRRHSSYGYLVSAEKASFRAQDLTRQLLTFSKGGAPVKKTTVLGELVRDAAGFALRGSRVRCDISVAEDLALVDIDEGQIMQVIHNLVINADHAMPDGGVISIDCTNIQIWTGSLLPLPEGAYVVISVQDHGIGIAREHLSKVFDPYFTTKQKGSGLGLATTYSVIKKHGGHVTVHSHPGEGTAFHVYLPVSSGSADLKKPEENQALKGSGSILVMDDEPDVREATGNVLKRLGYTVAYAADGQEAIDMYRQAKQSGRTYDLFIMDLTVPGGMGGKEAIRKLHELDPAVKAIVSSGYSNDPIMADFKTYGFSGVVEKPFRVRDLSLEVHRVLEGKGHE